MCNSLLAVAGLAVTQFKQHRKTNGQKLSADYADFADSRNARQQAAAKQRQDTNGKSYPQITQIQKT
jgi:hypothetical protein